MVNVWATVVRDASSRGGAGWREVGSEAAAAMDTDDLAQPQQTLPGGAPSAAASSSDIDEVPLFATRAPPTGSSLPPALQAIAALIDEDDAPAAHRPKRKFEQASLGTAQVCLALTGLESGGDDAQPQQQRQRLDAGDET